MMAQGTLCELLRRCGDDRQRFVGCEYKYQLSNLVRDMWPYMRPLVYPATVAGSFIVTLALARRLDR